LGEQRTLEVEWLGFAVGGDVVSAARNSNINRGRGDRSESQIAADTGNRDSNQSSKLEFQPIESKLKLIDRN
jgi:hypothetical protein